MIISHLHFRYLSQQHWGSSGFTLTEALVGILMVSTFLGVTLQTIVSATMIRVKAQEQSEATGWIQEDLELVRYQAGRLSVDAMLCNVSSANAGYADRLRDMLIGQNITSDDSTENTSSSTKQANVGNRAYTLTRTIAVRNVAPYATVSLNYTVSDNQTVIARQYAEIIPNAFFSCS
jgi:type II secretory pathway pseudopilin PulG